MVSHTMFHVFLIGPLPTAPYQFEVGSSSAIVSDPVSEAAAFFACFDQPEVNGLNLANFLGFWASLCRLSRLQSSRGLCFSFGGSL